MRVKGFHVGDRLIYVVERSVAVRPRRLKELEEIMVKNGVPRNKEGEPYLAHRVAQRIVERLKRRGSVRLLPGRLWALA